ncbi:MAG: B12-binding domain-containing radical SAM protein [Deltaproteobacteria bacterium]|nr:B12-binding domain-containing radical SAM protein [Deltaproteobacteria bacterium]
MPKLLLITASSNEIRIARRSRFLNFQQITMPYLAARVPPGWHVSHVDEEAEDIDWSARPDVVGITFHTPSTYHAYRLAARFRSRGTCVALGGPHVTLLPEEASRHADVIFIGEAEGLWEEFLDGFATGNYHRVYRRTQPPSLDSIPMARKTLYHRNDFTSGVLFATRGCPYRCDFCSIVVMYPHALRKRPVAEVAAEYGSFRGKVIIFWDDNIAADKQYAKELFRAITPYRKWWSSQATIHAARDDEFLDAAAKSGCKQLFFGLESISQSSMKEVHKGFNRVEEYARIVRRVHSHGIAVQAGIVFGFDHDTPMIFKDTLDFLEQTGVQNATFNILTPYPGTPLFQRLNAQRRILTRDWRKYNGRTHVVFEPKQMSVDELLAGFRYANQRFYSLRSVAKRLSRSPVQIWWTLPLNLAYVRSWAASREESRQQSSAQRRFPVIQD